MRMFANGRAESSIIVSVGLLLASVYLASLVLAVVSVPGLLVESSVPDDFVAKDRDAFAIASMQATAATRGSIATAATGITASLTVIGGLFYTGRTYMLSRRGQGAERFARAVALLENGASASRAAGVLLLERLGEETDEQRWVVCRLLANFLRQRARIVPNQHQMDDDTALALHVLLRHSARVTGKRNSVSLSGVQAPRVDLSGLTITGVDLSAMNLRDADLSGTKFRDVSLEGAVLDGADVSGADLRRAWGVTADQLRNTVGSRTTKVAEGVVRPSGWS